jgi:ribonuclease-3
LNYASLTERLGVAIDSKLLDLALTHPSHSYENGAQHENYQRLEFFGDTILNFLVSEYLYSTYPGLTDAGLSQIRNAVISAKMLAKAAKGIELGSYIKFGVSLKKTGANNQNVLCDVFEAVLAAAYLSGGIPSAKVIIDNCVIPLINERDLVLDSYDPKKALLKVLGDLKLTQPTYEHSHFGPDEKRTYYAKLFINGEEVVTGNGRSIKSAENNAAALALKKFTK